MIRKAEENDINAIMNIWLNANEEAHDFIPEEYWESQFDDVRIAISSAEVYVFEDGIIKGFVGLVENYIAGIFVIQEFRSTGLGRELLNYLKNIKEELMLNVYIQNENAVRFYLKQGFQVSLKKIEEETGQLEYEMTWKR